jgi:hypothetical protein
MKNAVFWDVRPRGSCNNRGFGETYRHHHPSDKKRAVGSSETSVLTRATLHDISEEGIPQIIGYIAELNFGPQLRQFIRKNLMLLRHLLGCRNRASLLKPNFSACEAKLFHF